MEPNRFGNRLEFAVTERHYLVTCGTRFMQIRKTADLNEATRAMVDFVNRMNEENDMAIYVEDYNNILG